MQDQGLKSPEWHTVVIWGIIITLWLFSTSIISVWKHYLIIVIEGLDSQVSFQ